MTTAIVFDMDGVLVNTKPIIELYWRDWAKKCGFTISRKQMEQHIHGCTGKHTLENLFNEVDEEMKREIRNSSSAWNVDFQDLAVPGAVEMIHRLEKAGVRMALVTSSKIKTATKVMEQLNLSHCLPVIVTADQVAKGKPDPEPYLLAAERLKLDPAGILVFEDSLSGAQAALSAGMTVVGVNGEQAAKGLLDLGVCTVIPDFNNLGLKEVNGGLKFVVKEDLAFELER